MMKQRWTFDPSQGLERLLGTLERTSAEARQVTGCTSERACRGVTLRGDYVDTLFRKAVRAFDTLCEVLNAAGGLHAAVELEGLAATLMAELGPRLHRCGLRASTSDAWETDYLALEYALSQDPDEVFDLFDWIAREHLRPRIGQAMATAA